MQKEGDVEEVAVEVFEEGEGGVGFCGGVEVGAQNAEVDFSVLGARGKSMFEGASGVFHDAFENFGSLLVEGLRLAVVK